MKKVKLMMMTLMMSLCLSNNLNASIESSYRKIKRDAKTRHEMANDADVKSGTAILLLGCGLILLIGTPLVIINNRKVKKLHEETRKKKDILILDISKLLNIHNTELVDSFSKNKIKASISLDIQEFDFELFDLKIKEFGQLLKIDNISNNYQLLINIQNALKQELKKSNLIEKYGEDIGLKIFNHEYFVGMSKEQLIECKGKPNKIETEVLKTKTKEIYIYGNKSSGDIFNFVDGKLERFKDR